jgi:hypothetical protein
MMPSKGLQKNAFHRESGDSRGRVIPTKQSSSKGILACRAGTRAPLAGMHETIKKKKNFFYSFFMIYACISLQNMQKCIAIDFCFPFIEGKCLFLTLH